MLRFTDKVLLYTAGMTRDEFEADERTVDAVIRNLELIGETASRLPEEILQR